MEMILTVMADDKTGIVEKLSDIVASEKGNWLDSRLAHMSGKFAGIIKINCVDSNVDELTKKLSDLKADGILVQCEMAQAKTESLEGIKIEITSHDRKGIVKEVTATLASLNVNILELHTKCYMAPMSAELMFSAVLDIQMPPGVGFDQIEGALESLSAELMVDEI
ncbi:glycine cleavage system protein R [Marinicellulosiphila megalodicopiae]|uniref:glycine cleavage system protein R n=1 Tax=Marinicellulosiphila megalodicopiae TaxID=2724896 RepID=UPI003BAFFDA2